MQQIGVVGLSYRHAGTGHIAGFAIPKDEVVARLPALRAALGVDELVYLSTCNRVELVYSMADGLEAADCRAQIFQALTGREPAAWRGAKLRCVPGRGKLRLSICSWWPAVSIPPRPASAKSRRSCASRGKTRGSRACAGATLDHVIGEALAMSNRVQQLAAGARPPSLADLAIDRMHAHLRGRSMPSR